MYEYIHILKLPIQQCCGSGSAWILIKLKGSILIRIRIKLISWLRIRINFEMTSQNVWNVSVFEKGFDSLFGPTIRIRIKVKGRIRIRICTKVTSRINPDRHQSEEQDISGSASK
jgi:hypothetical protein